VQRLNVAFTSAWQWGNETAVFGTWEH